jgi:hypothetical protein
MVVPMSDELDASSCLNWLSRPRLDEQRTSPTEGMVGDTWLTSRGRL